jgi:hypothetical protein
VLVPCLSARVPVIVALTSSLIKIHGKVPSPRERVLAHTFGVGQMLISFRLSELGAHAAAG